MTDYFLVELACGPEWDHSRGRREQDGWDQHVADCAAITLHPTANSWYMGANVPGKPRVFYPYIGGVDSYRAACDEVRAKDYLGFRLTGPKE